MMATICKGDLEGAMRAIAARIAHQQPGTCWPDRVRDTGAIMEGIQDTCTVTMRLSGGELELSACRNPERPAEPLVRPCYVMEEDPARCVRPAAASSCRCRDEQGRGALPTGTMSPG
jgi:hypothetical protein